MRKQYCLLSIAFLTLLVTAAIILFTGCSDNKPNAKNQEYTAKNAFKLESETRSENDTTPANEPDSESDYERLWQEVEDFRSKALVKSELKRVERIRSIAKKYNNAGQFIRAVIRKIQFIEEMEKEPLIKVIKELSHELEESSFPIKPVIHSLLAQQYWEYSDDNDYRILGRTAAADVTQEDMRTWDLRKMVEVVVKHYRKSLENPAKAKATRIELYDEILIKGSGRKFRPTLYDFLAHRAIDFYMNRKSNLTQPGYRFTLNNADYFKTAKEFAALEITTREPLSFYYQALTGLQELARFHLKDKNPEALLDVELKRYRFLYRTTGLPNKDKLYEKALRKMIAKYGPAPATATLYDALAVHYWDLGPKYKKPGVPSEYKSNLKKARKLCKEAIKKYPGTTGANHCLHLINRIEAKKLDITAENAVVPGRPFPTRIAYKNIGKIYVRLVKTYREEIIDKKKLTEEQMIAYFLGKNVSWKNEIQLPYDWDYQWYSTEIKIEALEPGEYLLLISNSKTFDFETRLVTYSWITASNIAYIQRNSIKMGPEFYVVNRETGRPLPNTSARVWYFQDQYDRTPRGNKWTKGPLLRTGKNGYLNILKQFPEAKDYFYLDFSHSGHRLFTKNHFFIYNMVKQPDEKLKTFFFTDRALYRPGQTVYFKGIMVDPGRKGDEEPGLVINRPTTVVFKDVNRREIDRLRLTTGAYGTFSGTFRIPTGRLNGNMRISNNYGSQSFPVEEYKRPKFDVRFPPVKEAYKLAETVTIKGKVTAYAGYKIDNGNVKYRVVRRVTYPYRWWCWGYTPPAPQMEIVNGVTKTNAKGEFQVKFKAIPDLTLAKANQPAFNYTVYADVTGSSGETNSGQTDISVGYIALKVGMDIPGRLDRAGGPYSFTIKTTSLSGDFLPAKGEISFFKLKENQRVCRKKLWPTPDKFVIDKNRYYTDFPHDNYAGEGDYHNWEKERRVYRGCFDTGKVKQLEMTALSQWKTGKYKMEMVSKDRYGTPVKEIRYFTLYSSKENKVPFKQLDWFVVPKKNLQPGEKALFLIGTSTREARVIYEIEQRGKIIHKQYITLRHEQKRIEFPIEEKHRGNLGFHFVFIKHNRLHRHTGIIQVPRTNKELDITFKTFRNKLRPGEKEEWRITIRGKKGPNGKPGEKVAAEMVATLYDASLDAFRQHGWGFDIYPRYSAKYDWRSNRYFDTGYCNNIGISEKTAPYIRERYDRLNWLGTRPLSRRRGAGLIACGSSGSKE
ncbi:MAG: hypothetical protein GY757_06975, partial [bacterium]|nr:hypothetical protein [bacterium]